MHITYGELREKLKFVYDGKVLDSSIRSLVKKGYLEQYTDPDGGFSFAVTKKGKEVYNSLEDNPESIFDVFGDGDGKPS
tara:strand:- start:235 stop:471 length:237 start_codon:yes stop_codon:yes gene_type:complete